MEEIELPDVFASKEYGAGSVMYHRRCRMVNNFQKQPRIKILPIPRAEGRFRLGEADLKEVVRTVESVLPQYENGEIDVTITLLEKNLKIIADMTLMKEYVTHLTKNAMDGLSGGDHFSLNINQGDFEIESLLEGFNFIAGACAFIYLAETAMGINEKMKEKMCEPFFTIKTGSTGSSDQNSGLPVAYRIIKEPNRGIRRGEQWGQAEVDIYLPLTKPEIVNMMSIPLSMSCKGA
jgi:nitrogen fixation/metabolism regulation signal transduction histidine kinase